MVVVADARLEARGRAGGLDAPHETLSDEHAEGVVHRLPRDGADFRADGFGHAVGGDVRLVGDGPQNRESLCGDLDPALTKDRCRLSSHT